MTEGLWALARKAIEQCDVAYKSPTHTFANEEIHIEETDVLTVAIAGSNDVWDWIQNLDLRQAEVENWSLSNGVLVAAKNVLAMVNEYRSENHRSYTKPIVFTGHSKGGAVAIACGVLSEMRHNKVERVTAFAAPRISTRRIIYPFPVDRFEAKGDPIPKLPIWLPWRRWRKDSRVISIGKQTTANVGREWFGYLARSKKMHVIENYKSILK